MRKEELPPIEGLILSHDHYDHLDAPTIEYLALRVQRLFVPLGPQSIDRIAALAAERTIELATPEIGEVVTVGRARENATWWVGLK